MEITPDVVKSVAELAQLEVTDKQLLALTQGMQNILTLADQMQTIDTSQVEPVSNPLDATARLRADEVTEENHREDYQRLAPLTESGLYLVPRVVE